MKKVLVFFVHKKGKLVQVIFKEYDIENEDDFNNQLRLLQERLTIIRMQNQCLRESDFFDFGSTYSGIWEEIYTKLSGDLPISKISLPEIHQGYDNLTDTVVVTLEEGEKVTKRYCFCKRQLFFAPLRKRNSIEPLIPMDLEGKQLTHCPGCQKPL